MGMIRSLLDQETLSTEPFIEFGGGGGGGGSGFGPLTFNQRLELEDLINKLLGPEDFRPLPVDPEAPGVFELLRSGKQNPNPFKLL